MPSSVSLPVSRLLVDIAPADWLRAEEEDDVRDGYVSRTAVALSPDGRTLVFSAARGGAQQLYV